LRYSGSCFHNAVLRALTMAYRPTEKTLARKAEIRQRLLDASLSILSEGGFAALTMVAVAARAGIATGAVYKHFESKDQLCSEVFREATEKEVAWVRETALQGDGAPSERLLQVIEAFALRALRNPRLAFALIAEPVDVQVDAQRLRYRLAYADMFEQLVDQGIQSGEFAPQFPSVSAAALVGVIAESLVGPLSWPAADQPPVETEALIAAIQAFCLRAVTAPKLSF
jgi:AcrR family transcriptional regulator